MRPVFPLGNKTRYTMGRFRSLYEVEPAAPQRKVFFKSALILFKTVFQFLQSITFFSNEMVSGLFSIDRRIFKSLLKEFHRLQRIYGLKVIETVYSLQIFSIQTSSLFSLFLRFDKFCTNVHSIF